MGPPLDLAALRARVAAGEGFDYLLFYGHTPPAGAGPAHVGPTCLSQWYPAPFEVGGDRYLTAEHWMMAEKARLFGDLPARAKILAAASPGAAKALGRTVAGFDDVTWARARSEIVVAGNLAKFEQHPPLRRFLVGTGAQVLVEASPRDRIWGIGLGRTHPDARDPAAWPGQNLLGFALIAVRARLAEPVLIEVGLAQREGAEAQRQVDAWRALAGAWVSTETFEDEVRAIHEARTPGRDVDP